MNCVGEIERLEDIDDSQFEPTDFNTALDKQNCTVCYQPCNFIFIQIVLGTVPEGGWFNTQAS
jgi:hypothetical protein